MNFNESGRIMAKLMSCLLCRNKTCQTGGNTCSNNCNCGNCKFEVSKVDYFYALLKARSALNKQISRSVGRSVRNDRQDFICPDCGRNITNEMIYCSNCGQKLDWEHIVDLDSAFERTEGGQKIKRGHIVELENAFGITEESNDR